MEKDVTTTAEQNTRISRPQREQKFERKESNLQTIKSANGKVLIAKRSESNKNNKHVIVVTPFRVGDVFDDDSKSYESGLVFPQTLIHRIENVRKFIKPICKYSIRSDDTIDFDCVNGIPESVFRNYESGYIHFKYVNDIVDGKNSIQIQEKGIWGDFENIERIELEQTDKIRFKCTTLKLFPILMTKGFLLGVINPETAILYCTVSNTEKQYIGQLADQYQMNNLVSNILPVFPLFSVNITERTAHCFLKNNPVLKKAMITTGKKELLLRFSYNFSDVKNVTCEIIGHNDEVETETN